MIPYDDFFRLIDIEENEIEGAKEYINLRGLEEHVRMARYLSSFLSGRKPTYKEVATTFRYDKRIRRIVYKYMGLIEEVYRAYICNHHSSPEELSIRTGGTLYDYCSTALFSKITDIIWSLDEREKSSLFEGKTVLKKNLDALVAFRNAVSHNRTLIDYRDFKEVTLPDGEVGNSLLHNIKNLKQLLPGPISSSLREEINSANYPGKKNRDNKTSWVLPEFLVIRINFRVLGVP